ncbi:MAG: flippase-like domain-containing protein [bacterium]|nr:flippase-like domain-containing protein [bacterium]
MIEIKQWLRRIGTPLLGGAISVAALWLTFRGIDWSQVTETLRKVSFSTIALLSLLNILFLFARAYRWQWLLKPIAPIPFSVTYHLSQIGALANNILPLRIGEIVRALVLKQRFGISGARTVGNIVLERVLDLIALIIMLMIAMTIGSFPAAFQQYARFSITIVLAALAVFLILSWLHRRKVRKQGEATTGFGALYGRMMVGMGGLQIWRSSLPALLVTFLMWLIGAATFLPFAGDLGLPITWKEAIAVTILTALGATIPAAPGFVGTYHLFCKLGLVAYGVPEEQAVVIAVLTHFFSYFWNNVSGVISMIIFKLHWRDILHVKTNSTS